MIFKGIQLALYEDTEGVKFVFILQIKKFSIHIVRLLKQRIEKVREAPKLDDPTQITEKPTGKILEPEDIINGIELDKPLQPEDM